MKILHCCLANFYIDNYGYQENILPKMHKNQGNSVSILASTESYVDNKSLGYLKPGSYINEDLIPVTRVPYVGWLPSLLVRKLRIYSGIRSVLVDFRPDIIFLHDTQFISIKIIARYVRENPNVIVYADGHTDFINSARGWISKNILHKVIYRYCAKAIEPYCRTFYGTLPSRVKFIHQVYNIPSHKIKLLELGTDDSTFDFFNRGLIRSKKRKELNIRDEDFVVVSGGKIDERKNIHLLVRSIKSLSNYSIKLILFGYPDDQMKYLLTEINDAKNILFLGWQQTSAIYDLLFASDLGFFPGTHSVLWEQSCGVGLPCVFKKWEDIQHVDLGGNCMFLDSVTVESIKQTIFNLYFDRELYLDMQRVAVEKGVEHFSYSNIAKRSIESNL